MDWIIGLPSIPGKYWGYCKHDGDMMFCEVKIHDGYTTLHNSSGTCIGAFGPPPNIPPHLVNIFTHFLPWSMERPKPPRK